jgi:hypothetical protein
MQLSHLLQLLLRIFLVTMYAYYRVILKENLLTLFFFFLQAGNCSIAAHNAKGQSTLKALVLPGTYILWLYDVPRDRNVSFTPCSPFTMSLRIAHAEQIEDFLNCAGKSSLACNCALLLHVVQENRSQKVLVKPVSWMITVLCITAKTYSSTLP